MGHAGPSRVLGSLPGGEVDRAHALALPVDPAGLGHEDVGPLSVPVQRAGPGHFTAYNFNIPLRGQWKLEVKVLLSDIDEATVSATVPVK